MSYDGPMDPGFAERAALRRARVIHGRVGSLQALEEAGLDFWAKTTLEERLAATHAMLYDAWNLQGRNGPPPRFDGSAWGVRKFER